VRLFLLYSSGVTYLLLGVEYCQHRRRRGLRRARRRRLPRGDDDERRDQPEHAAPAALRPPQRAVLPRDQRDRVLDPCGDLIGEI